MASRAYHEELWRSLPEGAEPEAFALRRAFLLENAGSGGRVLDLGCGEGAFGAELQRAGAQVLCADVAQEPLTRAARIHPGLELRLLDPAGGWDLPDSGFDVVWAGEVIEHVADTSAWLSEVRRVLRSGGRLVLTTPDTGPLSLIGMALSGGAFEARFDPRSDHLRFYSRRTLTGLLADFGFEQISVRRAGGVPGARRHLLAVATRSRF